MMGGCDAGGDGWGGAAPGMGGGGEATGPVASSVIAAAPHERQNRAPGVRRVPHAWQNMGLLYAAEA